MLNRHARGAATDWRGDFRLHTLGHDIQKPHIAVLADDNGFGSPVFLSFSIASLSVESSNERMILQFDVHLGLFRRILKARDDLEVFLHPIVRRAGGNQQDGAKERGQVRFAVVFDGKDEGHGAGCMRGRRIGHDGLGSDGDGLPFDDDHVAFGNGCSRSCWPACSGARSFH